MDRSVNDLPLDPQWYADTMNEEEVFDDDEIPQNVVIQRGDSDQECLHGGRIDNDQSLSISSSPTSLKLTKTPTHDISNNGPQIDVKPNGPVTVNPELDAGGEINQVTQPELEYENGKASTAVSTICLL